MHVTACEEKDFKALLKRHVPTVLQKKHAGVSIHRSLV